MSVQDVIKKSFLTQMNSADMSTETIMLVLLVTALIGTYIFCVYRLVCRKAFYSKAFAISLVATAMITSIIILTVQASVVISLGMVGALSIVRFRTAIKDPMDLTFMFWSIAVGIICGATFYEVAIEGSALISIVILLLHFIPNVHPMLLLLINTSGQNVEEQIVEVLKEETRCYKIKSRAVTQNGVDLVIELKTKNEAELIRKISEIEHVENATLMSHDGEATF